MERLQALNTAVYAFKKEHLLYKIALLFISSN